MRNCFALAALAIASSALAQTPRIAALYPAGAQAGQTVEVSLRGGGLAGAKRIVIAGAPGITGELVGGQIKADDSIRPLFNTKCVTCHEPRSPDNRTMSPEQWASTVDRMITARGADIKKEDRDKVVGWLQARARAGQVTAKLTVAKDAAPGLREVRLVTEQGVSSPFSFEISTSPELLAQSNSKQNVTLPVVVNGALTLSGQRDSFVFSATQGAKLTFNLKAYRLNEQSAAYFNPVLYLYNAQGKELIKSLGRIDLDPIIEWTCPADGEYTLVARDLLWKGNPASVYRLAMGDLPVEPTLSNFLARPGVKFSATVAGYSVETRLPGDASGVTMVPTLMGDTPVLVRDLPDGGGPVSSIELATAVTLPAVFSGRLAPQGPSQFFRVQALRAGLGIEFYAKRLASPVRPRITVRDEKGAVVQTRTMDTAEDIRLTNCFPRVGEYTVEVADLGSAGGSYCWETIGAGVPDFALSVTPDGANLAPGRSAALLVRAIRREAISGSITLTLKGLPKGIKASPAVIPPDDDKAVVILTADDATELGGGIISIEGTTEIVDKQGGTKTLRRTARPIELFRSQNNNLRPIERTSAYIGIAKEEPPFALSVLGQEALSLGPGQEAKVTVKVIRPTNVRSDVVVSVLGLPPGITVSPSSLYIQGNKDEALFTFRGTDAARYLSTRDPKLPSFKFVFVGTTGGRNSDAPTDCTASLQITAPRDPGIKITR